MRKGKFTTTWERYDMTESLAREFYALQGYVAPAEPRDYMAKSVHPQERACYAMALAAIAKLMSED